MTNTKIWIVYVSGPDWTNAEAFLKEEDAMDYFREELREPGVKARIKSITWDSINAPPSR